MSGYHEPLEDVVLDLATPLDWRTVTPGEAEACWHELRDWVGWLTERYSLDHRVVPPCWYLHNALVDLLTALRDHHREHLNRYAAPSGAADWHMIFCALEPRLREWASRTGCSRDAHRPDLAVTWPDDHTRWAAHLAADKRGREANETVQPRR